MTTSTAGNYVRWAHAVANKMLGPEHADHDDLVVEGLVAIWRAEETHDPDKGALPSWVTRAAELRMRSLAYGKGQWFGHEAMRGRVEVPMVSWEDLSQPAQDEHEPRTRDFAEEACWAYHHGQINQVIGRFTPAQQNAIRAVITGGMLTASQRAMFSAIRGRLESELEHLLD